MTAYEIANAIITRHPEYAGRQLADATLDRPASARSEVWPIWRDSVALLFDAASFAASKHSVIDGRLFLVGLGILESGLREALDARAAWAPLLLEVDEAVAPAGTTLHGYLQAVQFAHGYRSDRARWSRHPRHPIPAIHTLEEVSATPPPLPSGCPLQVFQGIGQQ